MYRMHKLTSGITFAQPAHENLTIIHAFNVMKFIDEEGHELMIVFPWQHNLNQSFWT